MRIKLYAYVSDYNLSCVNPKTLTDGTAFQFVSFAQTDMTKYGGVTVGEVEVDLELLPVNTIIGNAVVALRAKGAEIRAKAIKETTELESRVQQLLCIEA